MLRWLGSWLALALLWVIASPVAAADWVDEQTLGIYVFRAEFPLRDVEELVVELSELQKDLESTLDLKCKDRPIEIFLFRSRFSYSNYIRANVPDGAGRQAVYVAGNNSGRVYAYRHRDLATDLRHETTHALLHNALPYVPLWLDEGLAEYFEEPAKLRVDGSPHRRGLEWALRFGGVPSLAQLEAHRKLADFGAREYRDSWGWVHFMLHGPPEAHAALAEFLATVPTGREPTPVSIGLKRRLPDVEARFRAHFR
jgi:hypothetical protein